MVDQVTHPRSIGQVTLGWSVDHSRSPSFSSPEDVLRSSTKSPSVGQSIPTLGRSITGTRSPSFSSPEHVLRSSTKSPSVDRPSHPRSVGQSTGPRSPSFSPPEHVLRSSAKSPSVDRPSQSRLSVGQSTTLGHLRFHLRSTSSGVRPSHPRSIDQVTHPRSINQVTIPRSVDQVTHPWSVSPLALGHPHFISGGRAPEFDQVTHPPSVGRPTTLGHLRFHSPSVGRPSHSPTLGRSVDHSPSVTFVFISGGRPPEVDQVTLGRPRPLVGQSPIPLFKIYGLP